MLSSAIPTHVEREACEAFIKSQTGEGWRLIKTAYDDGGLSGGAMARPALQHLLGDIRRRRGDVVVVYKVDRLTRARLPTSPRWSRCSTRAAFRLLQSRSNSTRPLRW